MLKQFTFNHFGVNCYILSDETTKQCAIVDPGMEASYEDADLLQFVEENSLKPTHILLTHAHIDHICGLRQTCERFDLPVTMHSDGMKLLRQAEAYGSIMGFNASDMSDLNTLHADDGTLLQVGETEIECRHVPGHCPGSLCFVDHTDKLVITGDALFCGSIGRTDLPGGNHATLITKIKDRLLTLPDDYAVLPGHGEASTIGDERNHNPFLSY